MYRRSADRVSEFRRVTEWIPRILEASQTENAERRARFFTRTHARAVGACPQYQASLPLEMICCLFEHCWTWVGSETLAIERP